MPPIDHPPPNTVISAERGGGGQMAAALRNRMVQALCQAAGNAASEAADDLALPYNGGHART